VSRWLGWLGSWYEQHGDKLRFLVLGVWNSAFSYLLFLGGLAVLGDPLSALAGSDIRVLALLGRNYYLVIQWITWSVAVIQSTATIKYAVFRSPGRFWPQVRRSYLVYLPTQGLSTVLLWLMVRVLQLTPAIGQLVTIVIAAVFSYLGHKYFTFASPREVAEILEHEEAPSEPR
jgi:hypothetical protein